MFCLFYWSPESLTVTSSLEFGSHIFRKHGSKSSSSTGQCKNTHSGFSSESDSDFSVETETETETESETDSSDSEASFMGNLQNIDRNNNKWHQVLDWDNHEPSFTQNFSPVGTPGLINCIPSTSMPHEYVIMLLGVEFIDLLAEETNRYGDVKQLSKSDDENMNPRRKKWKHTTREEFFPFLGIVTNMGLIREGSVKEYWNKTDWSQDTPQLFLHVIDFLNCRQLFIFHRLRETVQNYKKLKQLFNILVNSFKNIMSQNSRFLLMKV